VKWGIHGYPVTGSADECAYSSWKSLMKAHIHQVRDVVMAGEDGASAVRRHLRE
jgi:hypothetical protein